MKNIFYLLVVSFMFAFSNVTAQEIRTAKSFTKDCDVKVKTVTFKYENKYQIFKRAKVNIPPMTERVRKYSISVSEPTPTKDIFKKVFSSERIKELTGETIGIHCICDVNGDVKSVEFFMKKAPNVSVEELAILESYLLKYSFTLKGAKDDQPYYDIFVPCRFSQL